jgi:hypothetical protein
VWAKAGSDEAGNWEDEPMQLVSKDCKTIQCKNCQEELGELSDENILHQSEYHSCAI